MSYKVKIVNNCEHQFVKSHIALRKKLDGNISAFTKLYKKEYDIILESGYLIFKSEAHYTMFLMRWSV